MQPSITAGDGQTCAVFSSGTVKCWGWNYYGQLGNTTNNGTNWANATPATVPLASPAAQVTSGYGHVCARLQDGSVQCLGSNNRGQLGKSTNAGTNNANPTPNTVSLGQSATQVAAGYEHTCALLQDGSVVCWGSNQYGALGNSTNSGTTNSNTSPLSVSLGQAATHIAAGYYHTCAVLADGSMKCWGRNNSGQLGNTTNSGTSTANPTPLAVTSPGQTATLVNAGTFSTCALLLDSTISCWGSNQYGQFGGTPTAAARPTPTAVALSATVSDPGTGWLHGCHVLTTGSLECMGQNYYGQLGNSTNLSTINSNTTPTAVSLGQNAVDVAVGEQFTCVLLADSSVKCMGHNYYGQLGTTTNQNTHNPNPTPTTVSGLDLDDAPGLSVSAPAASGTVAASFNAAFSASGATSVSCQLDSGAVDASCSSPKSYSGVASGAHTLTVIATNASGSTTVVRSFTVDADPPGLSISTPVDAAVVGPSTSVGFTTSGAATVSCQLDSGTADSSCVSPKSYSGLSDGAHSVTIVATDAVGNSVTVVRNFTVDATAPDLSISTPVDAAVVGPSTSVGFTTSGAATVSCQLDSGTADSSCVSPKSYSGLSDGAHSVTIVATDTVGNSITVVRNFTVDATAPAPPTLLAGPEGNVSSLTSAEFAFTGEPSASFECAFDGASWMPCVSPVNYAISGAGSHTFEVRQTDVMGNTGAAATRSFTLTAPVPDPSGPTGPPDDGDSETDPPGEPEAPGRAELIVGGTNPSDGSVVATVEGDAVTVGCRLDAGSLRRCDVSVRLRHRTSGSSAAAAGVLIGTGSAEHVGPGQRDVAVRIQIKRAVARRLARRAAGIPVLVEMVATPFDGVQLSASAAATAIARRVLVIPASGQFDSEHARLTPAARKYLRAITARMASVRSITCAGHTDSFGPRTFNARLGLRRASRVCDFLEASGFKGKVKSRSYGETRPRATNRTARGRALNRRVEIWLRR
ncbi:MAG: OmpA family protein [Actinobacteria bacterium]|nr:OmpA family protein [Actinomycetota bacterium]